MRLETLFYVYVEPVQGGRTYRWFTLKG